MTETPTPAPGAPPEIDFQPLVPPAEAIQDAAFQTLSRQRMVCQLFREIDPAILEGGVMGGEALKELHGDDFTLREEFLMQELKLILFMCREYRSFYDQWKERHPEAVEGPAPEEALGLGR